MTLHQSIYKNTKIEQGFLNTHKDRTVRVRLNDNKGFITVKGLSFEEAKNLILQSDPNLEVINIPPKCGHIDNYRTKRVWVYTDEHGIVTKDARRG